ncbi:hypothetical protein BC826DRAFT_130332 [Russula brevipes]|nr:hypothetical protein BC826DRAFT_130332 [Russula brevipes]
MSTQILSRCLHLPDEVLVEILSYLCPRDIAACQRACRQLNDIVVCSQFLQYLIRVGRSGLHDPMLPGYTILQRVEALERWEVSWRNLEAQSSYQVRRIVGCELAGGRCSKYIIRDDFLIAMHDSMFSLKPGYGYVDLRVSQPGGETDPWTRIIIMDNWSRKAYRFQFLPEQNLVVATFWTSNNSPLTLIELHGFSFSRGTPDPRFVSATITITRKPLSVNLRVVGNHTIITVSLRKSQRLFLHSWKDGRVSPLRDARQNPWSACCAVLSHDTIALVEKYTATLEVCRIVQEPDSDTPSLRTLVRLGLPPLVSGMSLSYSYCFPEQMPAYSDTPSFVVEGPGRPPRCHPFHNSPEERIIAISFSVWHANRRLADRSFTFVTHLRTLTAHATTTLLPEVNFIPWKDWGPSGTACFEQRINEGCVGERLAAISDGSLSLFDFNFTRVQNATRRVGHPSQDAVHSVVKDRVVIPRGRTFETDVVSELPYISTVIPTPFDWKCLCKYEEGLAGLSTEVRGQTFSLLCSSGN